MAASRAPRPTTVTIAMAAALVVGVVDIVNGAAIFLRRADAGWQQDTGWGSSTSVFTGVLIVLLGVFTILVALALGRGSGGARMILAFFSGLRFVTGLGLLVSARGPERASGGFDVVFAAVMLGLLFSASATAWLRGHKFAGMD